MEQPGLIRAYKLTTALGDGPFYKDKPYVVGETYEAKDVCTDENIQCAEGISLATMDWCLREWQEGYRIFVAEFTKEDIIAIPTATDGKFRVKRCRIVREVNLRDELDWPLEVAEE